MNRWDLFETFVHVINAGSFSAAAERLEVSKSLISRKIALLESQLGTQLLFRTTRQIHPTDAGYALYLKCEKLFTGLEEAAQSVSNREDVPRGHLRVVAADLFGERYLAYAAARFVAMHPEVRADIQITARRVDLVAEGFDLGLVFDRPEEPSLRVRRVFETQHVVCGAPAYFERNGIPHTLEDLRKHNCLLSNFERCIEWRFKGPKDHVTVDVTGSWRSNNGPALLTAALQGLGICRLPEIYVRGFIRAGKLVPVLEDHREDPRAFWLVYPNTRYVPAKVRLFIDYFCANIDAIVEESCADFGIAALPPARSKIAPRRGIHA